MLRVDSAKGGKTETHLDGIRGMAVLFIFIRHAWGLSGQSAMVVRIPGIGHYSLAPFVDMMSSGIDLFFVLSAFLLSQQFLRADYMNRERPSLRRYYRTRFLRIAPPYWVVLILTLLLFTPHLIPVNDVYSSHGAVAVLLHALFLQTAWFGSYGIWYIATPFWTLTIEVLFYAVLPWIMPLFYRNRAFWLGVPCALVLTVVWLVLCRWSLGPLVDLVVHHSQRPDASNLAVRYWLTQQIPASAFDFAMGIAMANLVLRRRLDVPHDRRFTSPGAGTIYAVLGIVLTLLAMWRLGVPALAHEYYFGTSIVTSLPSAYFYYFCNQLPFALSYGLLIGGVTLGIPFFRRVFSLSGLAVFGVLGYSVYLIHMQFLYLFDSFPSIFFTASPKAHFFKLFFAAGAAVFVCSIGLYLAVERPFIYRSRASKKKPLHAATEGGVIEAGPDEPPSTEPDEPTLEPERQATGVLS
jgi:peptidoglycan/LPS O-acetylase OafA/YrhL